MEVDHAIYTYNKGINLFFKESPKLEEIVEFLNKDFFRIHPLREYGKHFSENSEIYRVNFNKSNLIPICNPTHLTYNIGYLDILIRSTTEENCEPWSISTDGLYVDIDYKEPHRATLRFKKNDQKTEIAKKIESSIFDQLIQLIKLSLKARTNPNLYVTKLETTEKIWESFKKTDGSPYWKYICKQISPEVRNAIFIGENNLAQYSAHCGTTQSEPKPVSPQTIASLEKFIHFYDKIGIQNDSLALIYRSDYQGDDLDFFIEQFSIEAVNRKIVNKEINYTK